MQRYRDELIVALKGSNIQLSDAYLEIMLNVGKLKSQPYSEGVGVNYEKLKEVMHD